MHSRGVQFFSLWGGECQGAIFCFFFHLVLNVFSSCSHGVPQVVPNSTTILSHMVCRKFNSYVYKVKRWAIGEHISFYFGVGGPKRCCYGGVPNVSKKLVMGQSMLFPSKRKKLWAHPWTN
jgi:hypothetical protein